MICQKPTIAGQHNSTVIDVDVLKQECKHLGLPPSRGNIRRVRRAFDLFQSGYARLQADFGDEQIWLVMSQNDPGEVYTVRRNGDIQCTCPDYQKHEDLCKHGLSVLLTEESERDNAMVAQWQAYESDRLACYPEPFYLR